MVCHHSQARASHKPGSDRAKRAETRIVFRNRAIYANGSGAPLALRPRLVGLTQANPFLCHRVPCVTREKCHGVPSATRALGPNVPETAKYCLKVSSERAHIRRRKTNPPATRKWLANDGPAAVV